MQRRKLTDKLVALAGELACLGLPLASIAAGIGVHRSTLREWIQAGSSDHASDLERALSAAIHGGRAEGERRLVRQLMASREGADARWLLTHSPAWRDGWSDAAAERRALAAQCARMIQALEAAGLPPEIERRVLLHLRAAGVGVEVAGLTDDLPEPPAPPQPPAAVARPSASTMPMPFDD